MKPTYMSCLLKPIYTHLLTTIHTQELFDVGAVAQLVDCAKAHDIMTKRAVAFTLNNIASNPANHIACERLGIKSTYVCLYVY
jgi:hypothetical protein